MLSPMTYKDGGPDLHLSSDSGSSSGGSRRDFLKRSGAVGVGAVGLWAAPTVSAVAAVDGSSGSVADALAYCFVGFQRASDPTSPSPGWYTSPTISPQWVPPAGFEGYDGKTPAAVDNSPVEDQFYDGAPLGSCMGSMTEGETTQDAGTSAVKALYFNSDQTAPGPDLKIEHVFDSQTYTDVSLMTPGPFGRPGDLRAWAYNGYRIKHAYGWTPRNIAGYTSGAWYDIPVIGATQIAVQDKYTFAVELVLVPPTATP